MTNDYADLLSEFATKRPKIADVLLTGQANRSARLQLETLEIYFDAIEAFLSQIDKSRILFTTLKVKDFSRLYFLLDRARGDLEIALEAVLSGLHTTVADAMRDMMEITYLMRDFFYEPSHIEKWMSSTDKVRRDFFAPVKLREREAKRLNIDVKDLPDSGDYKAHSMDLHVNPFLPLVAVHRGVDRTDDALELRKTLWEILFHTDTFLIVIEAILHSQISEYPKRADLSFWSTLERQSKLDHQLFDFAYDTQEFIEEQSKTIDQNTDESDEEQARMVKTFFVSAYRIVAMRALQEGIENPKDMYAEGLRYLPEEIAARSEEYELNPIATLREIGFSVLQRLTTMKWDTEAIAEATRQHSADSKRTSDP